MNMHVHAEDGSARASEFGASNLRVQHDKYYQWRVGVVNVNEAQTNAWCKKESLVL